MQSAEGSGEHMLHQNTAMWRWITVLQGNLPQQKGMPAVTEQQSQWGGRVGFAWHVKLFSNDISVRLFISTRHVYYSLAFGYNYTPIQFM